MRALQIEMDKSYHRIVAGRVAAYAKTAFSRSRKASLMDLTEPLKKLVQAADGAAEENRADYVTPFPIHDAHTGAIILTRTSDLRIGADYAGIAAPAR